MTDIRSTDTIGTFSFSANSGELIRRIVDVYADGTYDFNAEATSAEVILGYRWLADNFQNAKPRARIRFTSGTAKALGTITWEGSEGSEGTNFTRRVAIANLTTEELLTLRRSGILNGCGPRSWKHSVPTLHASAACEQHDLAYWIGGTEQDRKAADYALYDAIRRASVEQWFGAWLVTRCEAWLFYRALRRWGAVHFRYGTQRTIEDIERLVWPPPPSVGGTGRSE